METKVWYLSKTIWTFFILFVVAIANVLELTNLELTQDANWVTIVLSVIAVIFRIITGKELTLNK